MKPVIVPEGEHIRVTPKAVVLLGEWGRSIVVECDRCGTGLPLRLCADAPIPDPECDALLNEYLRVIGWQSRPADVCPECIT